MAEGAMSAFLTEIGVFFTQAVTWLSDVLEVIVSNPALLVLVIAMPVVGLKICELNSNRVNSVEVSLR